MRKMARNSGTLAALALAALLAGCGGGGGGGGSGDVVAPPPASTVQSVAITPANGKAVAADAAGNVTEISAVESSTSLITGVQVQARQRAGGPLALAGVLRSIVPLMPAQAAAVTGVTTDQTVQCTLGGTVRVAGSVAVQGELRAGDSISMNASNCRESVDGVVATLNGGMSMNIVGGAIGSGAFNVTIDTVFSAFSVESGGTTAVANGDMRLAWNYAGPSSQIFLVTGTAFTTTLAEAGVTRVSTWRNYRQNLTIAGDNADSTLEANIETRNSALGTATVGYRVSGTMRMVISTGRIVAGNLTVEGATSRLMLGVAAGAPDTFTLQIDPEGDGTYQAPILVPRSELEALM